MESIVSACRRPTREAELALACNGEARASSRTGFHLLWRQVQVAAAGPLVCLGETSSRTLVVSLYCYYSCSFRCYLGFLVFCLSPRLSTPDPQCRGEEP